MQKIQAGGQYAKSDICKEGLCLPPIYLSKKTFVRTLAAQPNDLCDQILISVQHSATWYQVTTSTAKSS